MRSLKKVFKKKKMCPYKEDKSALPCGVPIIKEREGEKDFLAQFCNSTDGNFKKCPHYPERRKRQLELEKEKISK